MSASTRLVAALSIPLLALWGQGCSDDTVLVEGPQTDVPFGVRGSAAVGYRVLEIPSSEGERAIRVASWYPVSAAEGVEKAIDYQVSLQNPAIQVGSPSVVIRGRALIDAPVDATRGPYPLVVFSHGFSLNPEWYSRLVENYASHGFIVLAPEHAEQDWLEAAKASFDRPHEIKRVLDFAERLTGQGGQMAGQIDTEAIAVVGHSYGGYTALAMAGARFDLAAFQDRCGSLPPEDPKVFACAPFLGKEAEMAERAGLEAVPEGLWPPLGDPRVRVIVPIAGDAYLFDERGLASVVRPMMALGGTMDFGTPFEWGSQLAYEHAASEQKALVAFEGADHMIAMNPCEDMPWSSELPDDVQGFLCTDPTWDRARALDLIEHFSTAFLVDTLEGDISGHRVLVPDAVRFPGIEYTTILR